MSASGTPSVRRRRSRSVRSAASSQAEPLRATPWPSSTMWDSRGWSGSLAIAVPWRVSPRGIEGTELNEQATCLGEGCGGRRVEPLELRGVCGANRGKVQRER